MLLKFFVLAHDSVGFLLQPVKRYGHKVLIHILCLPRQDRSSVLRPYCLQVIRAFDGKDRQTFVH